MTKSTDPYWDELGVAWGAIDPNSTIIASRLETRLRRQSQWITAALTIGLPICGAGLLLGVATIFAGFAGKWNFITRGIAVVAMSAIIAFALWSLQNVRSGNTTGALSQMIDLAIDRTKNTLSLIRAGLYACVIAVVFGLAGTAIRTHFGRPPRVSPIIDVAMVGLVALVLILYGRHFRVELNKYWALRQALKLDAED